MNLLPTQSNESPAPENRGALVEQAVLPPTIPDTPGLPGSYNSYDQYGEEDAGFNLRDFWQKIWRRKFLVLTIVSLVTFFSALQSLRAKNVYEAQATIEIQPDMPNVMKPTGYIYQSEEYELKTSVFLLTSQPLLEDVVVNLKLDNNPAFMGGGQEKSLWQVFRERFLKAEQPVEPVNSTKEEEGTITLDLRERSPEERRRLSSAVGMVGGGTTIRQERGTRLVHIFYRHTNQELAALVANGIARTFIQRVFRRKTQKFETASDWLKDSTRELEAQMQQADQALADYTRRNNIFAQDAKDDLSATKLAHLHGELMKAETDRLLKQSLYEEVKQGRVAQLPEAFSNVTTSELQKKLSELTVQSAQLSVKYGSRNPKVVEVQQQMEALRKEINSSRGTLEEKLKADFERAVREENSMRAALTKAKSEAVQQNQTLIEYNVLKQKVETSKQLYQNFLQKTRQAEVEKVEQGNNVSMAQPASVPTGPVGPARRRAVMVAFLMSLAGSIALVLLIDHIDNRIKTVKDVGRFLHLPALGVIPAISANATKSLNPQNKRTKALTAGPANGTTSTKLAPISEMDLRAAHSIAESYRMLRTSVLLASAGRPPRVILLTSSQPSEGKTTTTVNTAICLAQLGAKVLIIDADMRRPRVHKTFGIKPRLGLSTYLSNEVDPKALIQQTGIPNLSIMPSGIIPPNAGDLLASDKMPKLLSILATQFDHVLIDSPPVINVADPVIIARHVDGVILVIRSNRCSRDVARHARTELVNAGAKILGVVLNNVDVQDLGYDYYYQRYYGTYASSSAEASLGRENGRVNGIPEAKNI